MGKSRRYLIAGNWKMNIPSSDAGQLIADIVAKIANVTKMDVLVCPPFTSIHSAKNALAGMAGIFLGAQNFYPEKNGAYTGEISAVMLRELGVSHVIVGHSERRIHFSESDKFINSKVRYALASNLIPILCVGETADQRKKGEELAVVTSQLRSGLGGISQADAKKLTVAYEPVWAIGTGETATAEVAQVMHAFIRNLLVDLFGQKAASTVKILYGGSMRPDNAKDLLGQDDIDGGLIGGASLQAGLFADVVKIAGELAD
ncbi:MAG: triose-phosphate isomerase [Puniceicoccales bacterium]|nr:triose-phosphate isomerase [Puniceicoccales bacterium]